MVALPRRSMLMLVAGAFAGCLHAGPEPPVVGRTELRSIELSSTRPLLAAFVLRVAASDLALDAQQDALASQLAREADDVLRPVDEARTVLVERVVASVLDGRWYEADLDDATHAVVLATHTAATRLLHSLAKLHFALEPAQRAYLVARVGERFDGWAAAWNAGTPADHPWLATFSGAGFPPDGAPVTDAVRTTRAWAAKARRDAKSACERTNCDDAHVRDVIARLRR